MTTYSFSLDHAVWSGEFPSREAAAEAGLAHAREADAPPETIYVGQRIPPDDRTYGYATDIVRTMRRRVKEDNGDLADAYLQSVSQKQIADLDNALQATIKNWLTRQNLTASWARIEAVSEYPVSVRALRS